MKLQSAPMLSFQGNIIDGHSHIGKKEEWAKEDTSFQPENIYKVAGDSFSITVGGKKQTDEIECCLVSNLGCFHKKEDGNFAQDEISGNQEVLEQCKQNPKLKAELACQVGVGDATNIEKLLQESASDVFALKFHPRALEKAADDVSYEPYLKLAEKYKKPCVFHSDRIGTYADPYKIYETAKKTPNVPVVLYHMSMADGHLSDMPPDQLKAKGLEGVQGWVWDHREKWNQDGIDVVKKAVRENKDANLYLEVSWTKPETIVKAIKEVGADRVIFGTDSPFAENNKTYAQRVEEVKNAIINDKEIQNHDDVIDKVFFENSNKLFFDGKLKQSVGGVFKEIKPKEPEGLSPRSGSNLNIVSSPTTPSKPPAKNNKKAWIIASGVALALGGMVLWLQNIKPESPQKS